MPTPDLRWAARAAAHAFDDRGPLAGANSPSLDAVPSLDREGRFVFISTRAYDRTLATIHAGRFAGGRVDGVALVPGLAAASRGWLAFDAGLSADGAILLFAEGRFDGGHVPREADLVLAARAGDRFARVADGARLLARVNTPGALEYAPALSADGLELFFTRADLEAVPPRVAILVARRPTPDGVFAAPLRIAAVDGFAEAPALSADGSTLLFHRRDADGRYRIYEARRPRPAAGGQASADRVIHSPSRSPSVSSSPIAGAQPTAAPTLSRRPRSSG